MATITVNGIGVETQIAELADSPVPAYSIVARAGQTVYETRHSIGATSGEIGRYDLAALHSALTDREQRAAEFVASVENIRQLGKTVIAAKAGDAGALAEVAAAVAAAPASAVSAQ
jgi:hypothetical protein